MEGKANTQLTVKLEGQEELITFDQMLENLLPNHGFPTERIASLRSRWNTRARIWAEEQGTLPGHAQKIAHDSKWKTVLPRNSAERFLLPLVREAAQRRQQEIANQLADLNAMNEHLNNFMNQQ